jgi:hypothetical protein
VDYRVRQNVFQGYLLKILIKIYAIDFSLNSRFLRMARPLAIHIIVVNFLSRLEF